MNSKIYVLMLLSFVGLGCGGDPIVAGRLKDPVIEDPVPRDIPLDLYRRASSDVQVECRDPAACHPSVGLVTLIDQRQIRTCNGFMVAPDLFATSSQCIPEEWTRAPALEKCRGRMWLSLAGQPGFPAERLECSRIELAIPIALQGHEPNYAWVRLKRPTTRPAVTLDRSGFADMGSVQLIRAEIEQAYGSNAIRAVMRKQNCSVVQQSMLLPAFDHPKRSVVSLARCRVPGGSEGALLLANSGDDRAALGIANTAAGIPRIYRDYLRRTLLLRVEPEKLVIGTNFACVPGLAGMNATGSVSAEEICNRAPILDPMAVEMLPRDVEALRARFANWIRAWREENGIVVRSFDWQIQVWNRPHDPSSNLAVALPSCVHDPEPFSSRTRDASTPYWSFKIYINSFLQKRWSPASPIEGPHYLNSKVSLDERNSRYRMRMTFSNPVRFTAELPYEPAPLSRCQ